MLLEHDATASSSPVLETKAEKLFEGLQTPLPHLIYDHPHLMLKKSGVLGLLVPGHPP